ncbi:MAG: ribosome silencing factor [Verrucomicrobia bacterium]|nr:ribosome silencing factor [Verrucomicrobiota bacterium]
MKNDPQELLTCIAQTIFDKKGLNVLTLDLRGVSLLTDYVVIAEGTVDRHVIAIGKAIIEALAEKGEHPAHVEGLVVGDWVVIDYIEIMVHLFMPGMRDKYQLEQLWNKGKILDVQIDTSPKGLVSYAPNDQS